MFRLPVAIRRGARRLAAARGTAVSAMLTLALGISATAAVFSVVRGVVLRPLPYPNSERLVALSHTLVVGHQLRADQSDATLLFYRRHNRSFAHLGGYQIAALAVTSAGGVDAERVAAGRVTADLLPALGVAPLRGRVFADDDDRPGSGLVAIIGERLWTRKYGRNPRLFGGAIAVEGAPHQVVGIMPASFRFPSADTDLWIPLRLDATRTESATFDYQAIGRLREGVGLDAAADDLQSLLPQVPDEFPGRMTRGSIAQTHMRATVRPLADEIRGDSARVLWPILGAALFVLMIACANVANLFLVRAESRQLDIAVQRALGASSRAILLEFASEAMLVSVAGGGLGILFALGIIDALRSLDGMIDLPRLHEVSIDPIVLAGAGAAALAATVLVTLVPAWRYGAATIALSPGGGAHAATATPSAIACGTRSSRCRWRSRSRS